jgi:hypothetical protein
MEDDRELKLSWKGKKSRVDSSDLYFVSELPELSFRFSGFRVSGFASFLSFSKK